jgi:hypothetical protein
MNTEEIPKTVQELRSVPGRRRWPTVVLMIVVFVAGIALGTGVTVLYFDRVSQYYQTHPEKLPERIALRLGRKLDLSRDQVRQVREIFAQRWPALQEARRQTYPILKPELDRINQQISALLNDRQKQKWNHEYSAFIQRMYKPDKAASGQPATNPGEPPAHRGGG